MSGVQMPCVRQSVSKYASRRRKYRVSASTVHASNSGCQCQIITDSSVADFFCMLLSGHVSRVDRYSSCMVQVDLLSA